MLLHFADCNKAPAVVVLAALAAVVDDCDEETVVLARSDVPTAANVDVDSVVGVLEVGSGGCVVEEVPAAVEAIVAVLLVGLGGVAAGCVVADSVADPVVGVAAGGVGVRPSDIALAIDCMILSKADALGPVLTVIPVKPPVGPTGSGPAMAGIGKSFS